MIIGGHSSCLMGYAGATGRYIVVAALNSGRHPRAEAGIIGAASGRRRWQYALMQCRLNDVWGYKAGGFTRMEILSGIDNPCVGAH